MFGALFRSQSYLAPCRSFPVFQQLAHSQTSVVPAKKKIKALNIENRVRKKLPFKKNFVENLLLDNFQYNVMEYPEIGSLIEYEALQRHREFAETVLTGNEDEKWNSESERVTSRLKKLELCGFKLPKLRHGFGYLESEYSYLLETVSSDSSLGKAISENEDFGIKLINLYGNSHQKETFLSKLATGESLSCVAHLESGPMVSIDPITFNTTASLSSDGVTYIVSGKKNWVYNAKHADVIVFSANVPSESGKPKLTLFVMDKNTRGIKVHEPMKLMGFDGVDVSEVTFDNVVANASCILGEIHEGDKIIKEILSTGKLNNGVQCITMIRKLVSLIINHCIHNKFINKRKFEMQFFNTKVSDILSRLYAVESMTYLIIGRIDCHDDPDVFLESLIVKIHASETLQFILKSTIEILGPKVFEDVQVEKTINEIIKNSQFLSVCEDTNDYLRLVLSTACINYVMEYKKKESFLKKLKEKLITIGKLYFPNQYYLEQMDLVLKKKIKGYIHLMFEAESYYLEDTIFKLKDITDFLLDKYGEGVLKRHFELEVLADCIINTYEIVAVLGRASRAYCLAVRFEDIDNSIAVAETLRVFNDCRKKFNLIRKASKLNLNNLGSGILSGKKYNDVHSIIASLRVKN